MEKALNGLKTVQNMAVSYLRSPYLYAAVSVAAGLVIAAVALAGQSPYAGEIAQNTIITAGLFLLSASTAGFGLFIAYNFARCGREVWKEIEADVKQAAPQLKAGGSWVDRLNIGRDIILVPRHGETKEQFDERVEAAKRNVSTSRWAVVFEPGNPFGAIYTQASAADIIFSRSTPPFDAVFAKEIPMPSELFSTETEREFCAYVEAFCRFFPEWSPGAKMQANPGRASETILEILSPVLIGLLLLFSQGLFAQKAAQVETALGTRIREIPADKTRIEYEFERGSVYRTADGRRDYVTLLKSAPMYRDGGGGKFIALLAGGRVICRGEQEQDVAARDEMRPYRAAIEKTDAPVSYSLPDSAGMVEAAERAKYEVWRATETIGQGVQPWWGVVMYTLWRVFPFLILAGGVSWLFAGVCAREGMFTLHKHARRIFAILALSVAAVLLVNFLLAAVAMGLGPVGLSLVAAAETGAAYWIVTTLIPDFRPAAGNHPNEENSYYNSRQLNG